MCRHPLFALPLLLCSSSLLADPASIDEPTRESAVGRLVQAHGEARADRIRRGVRQVAERWWPEDGDAASFGAFCVDQFIAEEVELRRAFERLQRVIEQADGHLHEIRRELTSPLELDTGPVSPLDRLLGGVDLAAHLDEDLFKTKAAFAALLNFPVHTLADRLGSAAPWDRETWARSRMMDRFALRIPAAVSQRITAAFTDADQYIAGYNIRLDRLVDAAGARPFPEGKRLISHWGLRDELKSQYAEPEGLPRQALILRVIERIVRQEIPLEAIDNGERLWSPASNAVWVKEAGAEETGRPASTEREPDTRYRRFLDVFHAVRAADPFAPTAPTYIERRFDLGREIREKDVEALLETVLTSDEFRDVGALVRRRLGRPLAAFDIWYDGFKSRGAYGEPDLDRRVRARYPDVAAFQGDLPRILGALGFSEERATWLARHIVVDPSRGAGHAMGAVRREDQAHLRTRFGPDGMDYKGYNIAIHELGHNVEQVLSLNAIDQWYLNGVPNTAFTEALAFVFQSRDLELLGLDAPGADARRLEALDTLWSTAEIAGVALLDMRIWRWMYAHPDATPAQLREATLATAREVWNRYFRPVFGLEDQEILAIYSHMIAYGLYLPDYPLGHIIAFQVADRMRRGNFGEEFERMARQGRLTPDTWMRGAVGQPISAQALLDGARAALAAVPD